MALLDAVACVEGTGRSATTGIHCIGPAAAALESRVVFRLGRRPSTAGAYCGLTAPPDQVCQSPPEMSSSSDSGSLRRRGALGRLADRGVARRLDRVIDLALGVRHAVVATVRVLLELRLGLLLALGHALAGLGERALGLGHRLVELRPGVVRPGGRRSRRPRRPRPAPRPPRRSAPARPAGRGRRRSGCRRPGRRRRRRRRRPRPPAGRRPGAPAPRPAPSAPGRA